MPIFEYEAMNVEGNKTIVDTVEARDTDEALAKVRAMNLWPTKVTEKKAAPAARGVAGKTGRLRKKSINIEIFGVRDKELTMFTRQLSTLTDAGIPVVQSLNILESQAKPGQMKNIIGNVADEVEGGASLSEGMAKYPKAFDELYCNMVKAGETGGMLDVVLERLAEFREKARKLKRKVIGALIYPVAVLSIASLILAGLIKFIIPSFIQMFQDLQVDLPVPTQILLNITKWCTSYWYVIICSPVALYVVIKAIVSTQTGKLVVDWMKFHVPLFGPIMNKSAISRFTRTFGTLIGSGVPILEALNISRDTAGNAVLARAIQRVHNSVREGDPIAPPLAQSKVCDQIVVNMINVGEETGNLDAMLLKIADNYDQEVDAAVEGLTSLMEPLMVIGMGGVIGFIVISLFLPLIKLMSSIK